MIACPKAYNDKSMTLIDLIIAGLAAVAGGLVNALAGGGTLITFPVLISSVYSEISPAEFLTIRLMYL